MTDEDLYTFGFNAGVYATLTDEQRSAIAEWRSHAFEKCDLAMFRMRSATIVGRRVDLDVDAHLSGLRLLRAFAEDDSELASTTEPRT